MYGVARAAAVVLVPLWMLAGCAGRPVEPVSAELDEDVYREHVRVLSSGEFDGRRPGTPGADRTVAYLAETFKSLGLKPGNGAEFTQVVPLLEITPQEPPQLSFTAHGQRMPLAYGAEAVIWSGRGLPLAQLQDGGVVFAGYGIVAPEFGWDDYGTTDVRDKLVIVLSGQPGAGAVAPFKGHAGAKYGDWRHKVQQAVTRGAGAVLLVHDEQATGSSWSAVQADGMGPRLLPGAGGGDDTAVIEGWVRGDALRAPFKVAGADFGQLLVAAVQRGFHARTLPLRAEAQIRSAARAVTAANVLALIPGRERPREYVFYSAHWDHLGSRTAAGGAQQLFPGAVDDASGVAAVLTLARSISRLPQRPERSIVFLCSTAAESGQLGAAWYVDHPVYPLKNTVAFIEVEHLRPGGPTRDVAAAGLGLSELDNLLRMSALLQGRELHADPRAGDGGWYRADAHRFAWAGVPVLLARAGVDDSARGPAWGRAQDEEFWLRRYHQPSDTYSAEWDVRGAIQDLDLYRSIGIRLARDWRFPQWSPSSEYRPLREQQRPEDAARRAPPAD